MPVSAHKILSRVELRKAIGRVAPLARAFDLLAEHVVITDANAHILYANAAAERATDFTLSEMLGKNPADLWGGHMSADFYRRMWQRIKKEKQPFVGEVRNARKDGGESWQELRISPILDRQNTVSYFIGIESVITDRKRHERTREELASVVSHEALSPLTAVRWSLEWLLSRRTFSSDERKCLEEISRENKRVINMFHDLATLSRMGKGYPKLTSMDLVTALREATAEVPLDLQIPKTQAPLMVLSIPSLVMEFLSAMFSAIAAGTRSGTEGACRFRRKGKDILLVFSVPRTALKKSGDIKTDIPALIARYLRWGTLETKKTSQAIEWSVRIPMVDL